METKIASFIQTKIRDFCTKRKDGKGKLKKHIIIVIFIMGIYIIWDVEA